MNFFRNLYKKILGKIFKKDIQNKDINEELINKFSTNEDVQLLEVPSETTHFTKEHHNYDNISVGNIIWAKRGKRSNELIPEGHEEGPFVVVGKTNEGLVCSPGSSVIRDDYNMDNYYHLDFNEYSLDKPTNFRLKNLELIDDSRYLYKLDQLNDFDYEMFLRNIKSKNCNYYYEKGVRKTFNVKIEIGDIILFDDKHYIVLEMQDNNYTCVRCNNTRLHLNVSDVKYLNYLELKNINMDDNVVYMSTLDNNLLKYVLKREQEYLQNYQNEQIIQRGSVVVLNHDLKYVYGEDGPNWLLFDIYKNLKYSSDNPYFDVITIRNKQYYTKYLTSVIDKNEEMTPISLAFEEEIDDIKKLKKTYKKRSKKMELQKQREEQILIRKKDNC